MIFFETHNLNNNLPYTIYTCNNLNWGLHFHRIYECIFVADGFIDCIIDHKDYRFNKGEAAFIMLNQLHAITTPQTSQIIILLFQPELIADFYSAYIDSIPVNNKFCFDISHINTKPKNIYSLKSVLYAICSAFISQNIFVTKEISSQDILIYKLIEYINHNYTNNCSLKESAHFCGCDYYYASKFFKKVTRMGFSDYVNNLRINQACYMIKNTNYSFITIANNCGFGSLRSFNRNFFKYCNCTPSEYKLKEIQAI